MFTQFEEQEFLEKTVISRKQLLYKFPLFGCLATLGFQVRTLRNMGAMKGKIYQPGKWYLLPNTKAKKSYNSLVVLNLGLIIINLATILVGTSLCAYQYGLGIKMKYLTPIENERELIQHRIEEIWKYQL